MKNRVLRNRLILLFIILTVITAVALVFISYGSSVSNARGEDLIDDSLQTEQAQTEEVQTEVTTENAFTSETEAVTESITEETKQSISSDYFRDAIFIGNSRTEGFALYSGLENIRAYTVKGLKVDTIFTDKALNRGGKKVTVMDAIKYDGSFSKAYIMLGMNELGWIYPEIFCDKYEKIINEIRKINNDAVIYIESILPVTKSKSESDDIYNNDRISLFNSYIKDMCERNKVYYLNVAEAVADETGALPEGAAFDGVHLKSAYCKKWLEYLKTHTVPESSNEKN